MGTTPGGQAPKTETCTRGLSPCKCRSLESTTPAGSIGSTAPTNPGVSPLALIGGNPEARGHYGPGIPPVLHPKARVEAFATIDAGTQRPTTFGNSWAFKHSHIGHDAVIGDGCEISTGAVVGGWAEIDDDVRIGLNATIRPRIKIGKRARIGMGAVVTKDVPAGETWIGVPARNIQTDPRVDPLWDEWY